MWAVASPAGLPASRTQEEGCQVTRMWVEVWLHDGTWLYFRREQTGNPPRRLESGFTGGDAEVNITRNGHVRQRWRVLKSQSHQTRDPLARMSIRKTDYYVRYYKRKHVHQESNHKKVHEMRVCNMSIARPKKRIIYGSDSTPGNGSGGRE